MNRVRTSALWWGFLLIGGGALWLADATGFVAISPIVVAIFFALAGIGFGFDFARDPASWWAAIPAGALLGLGALIAFVEGATAPGEWGASLLLAGTGFGFVAVYVRVRDHWWALIPGGLLLGAAVIVAFVPVVDRGEQIAVVVLAIMVAVLAAMALIPIRGRRMLWLLIPAGVLGVVAALLARDKAAVLEPFNWVSPAAILVVGLVIVFRTFSGRGAGRQRP